MIGFQPAKHVTDILSEALSGIKLWFLRRRLEALLTSPKSSAIAPQINDAGIIVYTGHCSASIDLLSEKALEEARNGSTVVFYAEKTSRENIVHSLLLLLFSELDISLEGNSVENTFFDAIPRLKSKLSGLDLRIGETQLDGDASRSLSHLQDELQNIIKDPRSKNVHCFITWIGSFDCVNDEMMMTENADCTYINEQLGAFTKKNDCKMIIGDFQGPSMLF